MRRGARSAALLTLLCLALLGSLPSRADAYRLLDEDEDAAQLRVELIRGAKRSIAATYFIVGEDRVALSFVSELRRAARRGIAVRLVVDAPFNALPEVVQAALRRDGVQIREYHPFRLTHPRWFARRLHDKLLVVDRRHLVTGGRNLEAAYFGRGEQEGTRNYVDRDAYVRGEAARRASRYFDRLWDSDEVRRTRLGNYRPRSLERRCEDFDVLAAEEACRARRARLDARIDAASRLLDDLLPALVEDGLVETGADPLAVEAREVGAVRFLHDPVGKKGPRDGIGRELLALMDATRTSMVLESPWLVPSRAVRKAFRSAVERGVRVTVLTNSLAVTDSLMTYAGYSLRKRGLSEDGIELREYPGPGCLHSKTGVFDGRTVVVGSFNLDPRSEHLNTEVAVVLEDEAAAEEALHPMRGRLESSVLLGPDGRPVPDGIVPPRVPWKRRLLLQLAKPLAVFVHRQL